MTIITFLIKIMSTILMLYFSSRLHQIAFSGLAPCIEARYGESF